MFKSSGNPVIQIIAFDLIIHYGLVFSPLPSVAEMVCGKRKEHIDVVTFSWKRQGVDYSSLWLCYYNAALRCLSTRSNSDKSAVVSWFGKLANVQTLDFSQFEEILACCKYVTSSRTLLLQPDS